MTAKQISKKLRDKGFSTKVKGDFVTVSLNRKVNVTEVEVALGFEGPPMWRSGMAVVVTGIH